VPLAQPERWFDPIVYVLVVANLVPILPVICEVVAPLRPPVRRRRLLAALALGNACALAFALGGGAVLGAMGSSLDDLRVAGGLILLVFAIHDLLFSRVQRKEPLGEIIEDGLDARDPEVGLVPLGIPLMVGPATLATVLVVQETRGFAVTALAVGANALVNAGLLVFASRLLDTLGPGAMRTVGKVFGLLLAALAVSMIRVGLTGAGVAP